MQNYKKANHMEMGNHDEWIYLCTSADITVRSRQSTEIIEKLPNTKYSLQCLASPNEKHLAVSKADSGTIMIFEIEFPHKLCNRIKLKGRSSPHMTYNENGDKLFVGFWDTIYMITIPNGEAVPIVSAPKNAMCVDLSFVNNSILGVFWGAQSGMGQHLFYTPDFHHKEAVMVEVADQMKIVRNGFLLNDHKVLMRYEGIENDIVTYKIDNGKLSSPIKRINRGFVFNATQSADKKHIVMTSKESISTDSQMIYRVEMLDAQNLDRVYSTTIQRQATCSISMSGNYLLLADEKSRIIPMNLIAKMS